MNDAATCNVAEQSLCALTHVSTEQLNKHYCHAVDTGRLAEACGPVPPKRCLQAILLVLKRLRGLEEAPLTYGRRRRCSKRT